ncbi:MAG: ABC transporter permease [Elusimicrobia bacterium]|nr:ABC transporter permease [Elusimicrobiota bacterium]
MLTAFFNRRELVRELVVREIASKYKGSFLGLFWSFITPLLMLGVYTFVFSFVFKARWTSTGNEDGVSFALTLFCGLIVFNLFAECVTRAPQLITANPHYVKKVVFPLEILPIVTLGSALFHYLINLLILVAGIIIFQGWPSPHILLVPLLVMPLCLVSLGCAWFLASFGVFVKDINYNIAFLVQLLFFMTPICYPSSAVPPVFRGLFNLNIISMFVESSRDIIIYHRTFNWSWWLGASLASAVVFILGYTWFMRTRVYFADQV